MQLFHSFGDTHGCKHTVFPELYKWHFGLVKSGYKRENCLRCPIRSELPVNTMMNLRNRLDSLTQDMTAHGSSIQH